MYFSKGETRCGAWLSIVANQEKKTTLSPVYRGETAAGQRRPFYLTLDPQFLSLRFEVQHTLMGAARSRRGPRSTGFPAPRAMREEPVYTWAYPRSHTREPRGHATTSEKQQ